MRIQRFATVLSLSLLWLSANTAHAHFLWLVPTTSSNGQPTISAHFSEAAEDPEPDLLDRLEGLKTWYRSTKGEPQDLTSERTPKGFVVKPVTGVDFTQPGIIGTEKNFGIVSRGETKFLLQYYAKAYLGQNVDQKALGTSKALRLDVVPTIQGDTLTVAVTWEGKPVADSEVVVKGPGLEGAKQVTGADGLITAKGLTNGLISIRARHVEAKPGQFEGKDYAEVRHYITLSLPFVKSDTAAAATTQNAETVAQAATVATAAVAATKSAAFPPLPEGLTSFGGATLGDWLYVYGGNIGEAHEYFLATASPHLRRLNLKSPEAWEDLAPGPRLQGVALVACKGRVIRIGGFCAHNAEGQEENLWSVPDVAAFDPETKEWSNLPPLPAPRSSHDAAVIGNTIYVVGGWQLRGTTPAAWHDNAWSLDLAAENPVWQALPSPGFQRRALSAAELNGKLYVIGGMSSDNKMTSQVSIFDPESRTWTAGPNLPGKGMEPFGTSCFALNQQLVVTTFSGKVWSLAPGATEWKANEDLKHKRFFHRVVPYSAEELIVVGGSSGEKVLELETVRLK